MSYTYQEGAGFHTPPPAKYSRKPPGADNRAYPCKYSGSVITSVDLYKSWQLNYSFIYVGDRYHSSANTSMEYEQPWHTNDMTIVRKLRYKSMDLRVSAEVNNIFGQGYGAVLNYPMPDVIVNLL